MVDKSEKLVYLGRHKAAQAKRSKVLVKDKDVKTFILLSDASVVKQVECKAPNVKLALTSKIE